MTRDGTFGIYILVYVSPEKFPSAEEEDSSSLMEPEFPLI